MTTLRRLMVAVYPIRLVLLVLATCGLAEDVYAQGPIRVGYYDMTNGNGGGIPEQVPPIVAAGFTPVLLDNVTAADLAGLHILFVENPSPNVYGQEYLASRPAIAAAVNAGMVLVIHDRTVNVPAMAARVGDILPGVTAPPSIIASKGNATTNNTIELSVSTGLIANGPFGSITSTNLDGGMQSNHGHVNILNPFFTTRNISGLLHTGSTSTIQSQSVTFSYAFGLGYVIYSTIPLDKFLKSTETVAPVPAFRDVYAPNVLTYAACGLKAFPATVTTTSATGHYGGTTTLTATVKCGVIPVADATVTFSLNGAAVGSAQTDASGTATIANASLGSSPESAIAVGSHPDGVLAAFAGTTLYGASSGTASLTVEKAPASISFDSATFVYDAAPHAATGSATGVFGEPLDAPSFSYTDEHDVTSDVAPVHVGTYKVTASTAESTNYLGTTVGSGVTIRITPASLVITADDKTKVYGAAVPALTGTYQGFVGNENPTVLGGMLELATDATAASRVDKYDIEPSGVTSDNYDITFVKGVLAVTPASLTVHAESATKTYGAPLPDFSATHDGFVLGETAGVLDGALHFTTDASASSMVGTYTVTPTGLRSNNYAIAFASGFLSITPAPLKIRADDKERLVFRPNPLFTVAYEGFVLGDNEMDLDARPRVTTPAKLTSPDGLYPIHVRGAADANYTIEQVDGRLTVSPEGRMRGSGAIDSADAKHRFEFDVRETIFRGAKGSLKLEIARKRGGDDLFVSHFVDDVVFSDLPAVKPGGKAEADSVTVIGVGRWNGQPATFEASATDKGEPGAGSDTVTLKIFVGNKMVNMTSGTLRNGNIQSNRLRRR